jgi:Phage tail protein
MTVSVTIDDVVFYGDGTSADWVYQRLQGWYSGAPVRGDSVDNPNSDGASPIDVAYRSARPLKFTGVLAADTVEEALQKWMDFASIQSDGIPFPLTVTDPYGTLTCTVSVVGVPEVLELNNTGATVTVSMTAYDPIKYGPNRGAVTGLPTAGGGLEYNLFNGGAGGTLYYGANGTLGRVTLTNSGTARVWPSVTVTGQLTTGFSLQRLDTGQVVRYDRVVPAGASVSIDFRTGETLVDGVSDGSTYLTRYEFWAVDPGESIEVQFNAIAGSSGTPQAAWVVADGFW